MNTWHTIASSCVVPQGNSMREFVLEITGIVIVVRYSFDRKAG
ncbi:hypothetical protein [Tropheryma whipplei]|nr:hypothetical protein [Tropheryma whipplei]